ncbi:translation initiation factor IF-3 [Candidatus Riflebacteria bacterium]
MREDEIAKSKYKSTKTKIRINENINAAKVRLVGKDGEQIGVVSLADALRMAKENELDLVEVAPDAEPPVCKIKDYGRMLYEKQKKAKAASKKQKVIHLKEIKIRPKIDLHDLKIKAKNGRKFLLAGDKVKITMFFRGRERRRKEFGIPVFEKLLDLIGRDILVIENPDALNVEYKLLLGPNMQRLAEIAREKKQEERTKQPEEKKS